MNKPRTRLQRSKKTGLPGRPTGPLLLSATDGKLGFTEVFEDKTFYSIFYDGKPVKVRRVKDTAIGAFLKKGSFKYKRTTYAVRKQAETTASKLNKLFDTDRFEVFELVKKTLEETTDDTDDDGEQHGESVLS